MNQNYVSILAAIACMFFTTQPMIILTIFETEFLLKTSYLDLENNISVSRYYCKKNEYIFFNAFSTKKEITENPKELYVVLAQQYSLSKILKSQSSKNFELFKEIDPCTTAFFNKKNPDEWFFLPFKR